MSKFGNVMIIGLGMIGGSFAKALKEKGLATLYGVDRRKGELALGVSTGVIDYPAELTAEFVSKMDVIMLATPVRAMSSVLAELKPLLSAKTLLTDAGSTKGSVVASAREVFGEVPKNFIPGHPIAGAEKSGVLAANPKLFENHMAIVTPLVDSDPVLLDRLHQLWSAVGADVVSMEVDHHDHVLASSSHLPHLLAYTLVDSLANSERSQDVFKFAAGGFRDFTRIASSDPVMWRDVFMANKDATLATLDQFTARLADMRQAIEEGDGATMFGVFTRAKSARDHFLRLLEQRTVGLIQDTRPVSVTVAAASAIKGKVYLQGDRSLSHKAITMAALAQGVSNIDNIELSGEVRITLQAFRDMGVVIEELSSDRLRIHGVGLRGLKAPIAPINVHTSMESLAIMVPVLAGQDFSVVISAEQDLLTQPQPELIALARSMGKLVESADADCLPLRFSPNPSVQSDNVSVELASHGAFSVLLADLYNAVSGTPLSIRGALTQADTLLLESFAGATAEELDESCLPQELIGQNLVLPADLDQSAFLALLATLLPGSDLLLENVASHELEAGFLGFMNSIGANIVKKENSVDVLGCQSVVVSFTALKGFVVTPEQSMAMANSLPLLCAAAVYAQGDTCIQGINLLPYYCEDRILALVDALGSMQVNCSYANGELNISGGVPQGGELDCAGDVPMALAMLVLGVRSRQTTRVNDCQKLLEEFNGLERVVMQLGFHCTVTQ
ncbi:prephenate dehydrogenase/arogenate dehydrogenase family protein [Marinomonas sp.]